MSGVCSLTINSKLSSAIKVLVNWNKSVSGGSLGALFLTVQLICVKAIATETVITTVHSPAAWVVEPKSPPPDVLDKVFDPV